ncbi:hypothetical protein BSQ96_04630 [Serratia proteamaculans]|nr:hypothetical protein BSQ96_04630 [Serratia proteamaculans]
MLKERSFCVDLMEQMIMIMLIIINIDITLLNLLLGYSSTFTKSLQSGAGTGSERRLSGGMKNKDLKKRWA